MVGVGHGVGTPLDLPGVYVRTWGWGGAPLAGWTMPAGWRSVCKGATILKGFAVESVRGAG